MSGQGGDRKQPAGQTDEVDNRTASGWGWSHNFLNQKPWHPMSYRNQRKKWIAEQIDSQTQKRRKETEKEFTKEQEFFKNAALLSKKEKEKVELLHSVSFLYTKPPGYSAEFARAAEVADDERKRAREREKVGEGEEGGGAQSLLEKGSLNETCTDANASKKPKKVLDVFGRVVLTGEENPLLKNAPREETGIIGRPRPFGIEIKNVRCAKCLKHGHQVGDKECPMRDEISEKDKERQQREDPLSVILACNRRQPFAWELKPSSSLAFSSAPIMGGFSASDENQQILPPSDDDEIEEKDEKTLREECMPFVNEYGGFLVDENAMQQASLLLRREREKVGQDGRELKERSKEGESVEEKGKGELLVEHKRAAESTSEKVRKREKKWRDEKSRRKKNKERRIQEMAGDTAEEKPRSERKGRDEVDPKHFKKQTISCSPSPSSSSLSSSPSSSLSSSSGSERRERRARKRRKREKKKRRGNEGGGMKSEK